MRISDWSSDVCSSDLKISSGTEKIDSTGGLKASSATTKSTTDHSLLRRGRFMPPRSRRRQAEQGARPPDQIAGREGFRHVVVGAELQSFAAVELAALGRQHHDLYAVQAAVGADRLADVVAVAARQHDVEHDEVRRLARSEENTSEIKTLMRTSY